MRHKGTGFACGYAAPFLPWPPCLWARPMVSYTFPDLALTRTGKHLTRPADKVPQQRPALSLATLAGNRSAAVGWRPLKFAKQANSPRKAQALSILNTFVPQVGQTPWVAGLRFLSVTRRGFLISTFFLHFIQYAVAIVPSFCFCFRFGFVYIVTTSTKLCQYPAIGKCTSRASDSLPLSARHI